MTDEMTHFLMSRTFELMGGRDKALASMEADYNTMKERWNQDTDKLGRILRAQVQETSA